MQYLTTLKIRVLSGDIRLPHACNFFLPNSLSMSTDLYFRVSAISTDSNYIECRIPFEFDLLGRIHMSVIVNDECYSNFVEIHTYNLVDILYVSPKFVHGSHHLFPIEIKTNGG
jgi:hypothetical protein